MLTRSIFALTAAAFASLGAAQGADSARPCGLKIAPCPSNTVCIPNSPDCSDLNRCRGTCQKKYPSCGGHRPNPPTCDKNSECLDDPRIPGCGMACDRPGICIPKNAPSCSGFAGRRCPQGLTCYDKPNDGCDPKNGGADCIGVCL
ncbi:hypothetical protein XA68_11140 [Ophiocordyceps unilateralis]|uniref:Uncharacterized protein n=1 Tax=Ophiocordyceps unilateralis TaxID=268505 RepID=A0A2A9PG15_OPHUN|nr:hypothetical protein XA68_11140 [Ophiocordyceps unilateralis]